MSTPLQTSALASIAIDAALKAGKLIHSGFGTQFEINLKPGIKNYVTEYDIAAERLIIETIRKQYPDHEFLGEESGSSAKTGGEILWIIDPLDGTTNYAHSLPVFCVSIGALSSEGLLCGVIYEPITNELFVAEKGKGAFLNGNRIRVSSTTQFAAGIGATSFPRNIKENPRNCIDNFIKILKQDTIVRNLGSSVLNMAYVAAGRFDGFWALNLHPWDIAAGILMVEEAGGKVTTYDGEPYSVLSSEPLAASNGIVHRELLNYIHS